MSIFPLQFALFRFQRCKNTVLAGSSQVYILPDDKSVDGIPKIELRIETLSDLVFGLALSIGAISLIQHIPQAPADLIQDVTQFGFSFLIIVGIWLGYTRILSVLSVETSGTLLLNLALLFCVAVEPFLYYVFQFQAQTIPISSPFLDFSSAAFALDTGAMMGLLAGMTYLVVRQENRGEVRRLRATMVRKFRFSMISGAVGAAVFMASASEIFWIQVPNLGYLRFFLWYIAMGIFFASRLLARRGA